MRIALFGYGSIGKRHRENLRQLGYDEVAVCDPAFPTLPNTEQDIWNWHPDVVIIATPTQHHTSLLDRALHAGAHCFVEKPLSYKMAALAPLDYIACSHQLTTMVGCNMRFHPGPDQIQQWLQSGVIGDVLSARLHTGSYLPRWRPQHDYHDSYSASPVWGGAVLDCIHELDLAVWLLGEAKLIAAVTRPATSLGLRTDGLAEILLEHTSGAVSSVHLNFVQRHYQRNIEIIGTDGSLVWDWTTARASRYDADGEVVESRDWIGWDTNQMYLDELRHFFACVETGIPTVNPLATASVTLRLALAVRKHS